jgi:hypothetical protein
LDGVVCDDLDYMAYTTPTWNTRSTGLHEVLEQMSRLTFKIIYDMKIRRGISPTFNDCIRSLIRPHSSRQFLEYNPRFPHRYGMTTNNIAMLDSGSAI